MDTEKYLIDANISQYVVAIVVQKPKNKTFILFTEFYEEAFSLVYDLTSKTISPDMWQMLQLLYQVFEKDAFDYFLDLMPALHNYVTIDTEAFLSNPAYVTVIFEMCKKVCPPFQSIRLVSF